MFAVRASFVRPLLIVVALAVVPSHARRRDLVAVDFRTVRHRQAGRPAKSVRVVDGDTAAILEARSGTRLRLRRVSPFVGFAVGSALDGAGGAIQISPVFRHDAGRVTRLTVRATPAAIGGANAIVGLGDVPFSLPDGQIGNAAGTLLGRMFQDTANEGVGWVDETSQVKNARQREIEMQEQGVTDPSTHIEDTPLTPDLHMDGNLTESDGRITGEIRLTDPTTGEVTRIPIDEPLDDPGDWPDVVRRIVERVRPRLRERLRRLHPTTTTTATTSTTASTATTISTTTVALSTTTQTTAPSTVATTSTTTSSTTTSTLECATSADCGATACCNVAHRCCDLAHPDPDACGAGAGSDHGLSCSYLHEGAPPADLHGECGPQTPPTCPAEAVNGKSFACNQCNDTGKYVAYLCCDSAFAPPH